MKLLNKAEAAAALGISVSTLKRRMVNKTIEYTTAPQSRPGEATVWFTYAQLGLPEPEDTEFVSSAPSGNLPEPSGANLAPHQAPITESAIQAPVGPRPSRPAAIALPYQDEPSDNLSERPEPHSYRDSMGNTLNDADPVSLLGPNPPVQRDSARDLRYQPIRFHNPGSTAKRKEPTGYSSGVEDADYIAKHWPGNYGSKTP